MRKRYITAAVAAALVGSMTFTSCIGSFTLTNKLLGWNRTISNKFVNELVFVAFWILPVYEVSALADLVVLNSVEFWSGTNPVATSSTAVEGENGSYLVECDGKGYTITSPDGVVTRLDFDVETQEWAVLGADGERTVFLAYLDSSHVKLPAADGSYMTVELSQEGLYAYRSEMTVYDLAVR